jgi:enoyl-CoA hydratase
VTLRIEDVGDARVLTLARPEKRNALSSAVCEMIERAVLEASGDARVRGVVLAADGPVFAAGGDLTELAALLDEPDGADRVMAMGARLSVIERATVPVVAAVAGSVFGGGCELLLLCDWVVVEPSATLTFKHAAMGLAPAWGGASRLVERVGAAHAGRLLMTAAPTPAADAVAIGLASELAEEGRSLTAALHFVDRVAGLDRDAVAAQKASLSAVRAASRGPALAREADVFRDQWGSAAHRAALAHLRPKAG